MPGKTMWLSWMPQGEGAPQPQEAVRLLQRYGLKVSGAGWVDDLPKLAWAQLSETLLDANGCDGWIVAGNLGDLQRPSNRQALSLLATCARQSRGEGFPMLALCLDGALAREDLPLLAQVLTPIDGRGTSWPAKVIATLARKTPAPGVDFHLSVHAHPMLGQFFEVGPMTGRWNGVMFGVHGEARITHHAVGVRGEVPERGVVEYELVGIEAEVNARPFSAWAVKNPLGPDASYFLRVEGAPAALLVGPYPGEEGDVEATVIDLA